ncbi:MAG: sugar ABC transporter permease [Chitinivibrionales bacterium]|nr:sugar ABC transporter permease [Chitinivibrionales bacterium]
MAFKPFKITPSARRLLELWPLFPAAVYLIGFLIVVVSYLFALSFSFADEHGVTIFPSFESLRAVFAAPEFNSAFVNTIAFVAVGTPLELIVGLALALLVYRSFHLRNIVRSIFIIPLAIPALVTATMLFILFDFPGGHINHLLMGKYCFLPAVLHNPINWRGVKLLALGIALAGKVWRDMPISMLILLAGLNAIDPELFDAAKTMGAGLRQRLWRIVVPLILPSISTVVLLRSLEMWKEFIFPFILAGQNNLLGTLIEILYNNWGNAGEAAVVSLTLVVCIVVTALVYLVFIEFVKKLTARR